MLPQRELLERTGIYIKSAMGDEDEVLILGVDYSTDCLCLSRSSKIVADPTTTRKRRRKKDAVDGGNITSNGLPDEEACLLIVDDKSTEDNDCVEVDSGGHEVSAEPYPEPYPAITDDGQRGDSDISVNISPIVTPTPKICKLSGYADDSTNFLHIDTEQNSMSSNELHVSPWEGHLQKEATSGTAELESNMVASQGVSGVTNPGHQFDLAPEYSAQSTQHLQQQDLAALTTSKDQTVPSSDLRQSEPMMNVVSELQRIPKCWTKCPNCPPDAERKFHLIDVEINSAEWTFVSSQLLGSGFTVTRIERIQNESLWQRLCYEKQLMLRERKDINEQLLYHTSRCPVEVICEEGLDLRLSMNGSFGCGIYFR